MKCPYLMRTVDTTVFRSSLIALCMVFVPAGALDLREEVDLSGAWAFEIGDNKAWAQRRLDDGRWEKIKVPGEWENQGFPGYDGYAWYRKRFVIPQRLKGVQLFLRLGMIDDVDVTYLNGREIGSSGEYPPNYETAYNIERLYRIPKDLLRFGKDNVIAVKVYDFHLAGGLLTNPVGIYSKRGEVDLAIDLSGQWRFAAGDDSSWAASDFSSAGWKTVSVPSTWERQGFPGYDGIGWYRKTVVVDKALSQSKLILMLGRIDDFDKAYFNGTFIGQNAGVAGNPNRAKNLHLRLRAYFIPPDLVRVGKPNTIAVRVYDRGGGGGIHKGPVGVLTRQEFLRYGNARKH